MFTFSPDIFWDFGIAWVILGGILIMASTRGCRKEKAPMSIRLDGKTVLITGCNTGIGKATAKNLAHRGARIIMGCRDIMKAEQAAEEIRKETGSTVIFHRLDLADFQSIHEFADIILQTEAKIDILINNAGVYLVPQSKTKDGFEMHFGINYLGHFLLTILLLERIKESAPARIINVSSSIYAIGSINFDDINLERNYNGFKAYAQSKLANILFTRELAKRLHDTGVNVYSLHPGLVKTDIATSINARSTISRWLYNIFAKPFIQTPEQGARTSIYCAVAEELSNKSGLYYSDSAETRPLGKGRDDSVAKRLWDVSMELTELKQKQN